MEDKRVAANQEGKANKKGVTASNRCGACTTVKILTKEDKSTRKYTKRDSAEVSADRAPGGYALSSSWPEQRVPCPGTSVSRDHRGWRIGVRRQRVRAEGTIRREGESACCQVQRWKQVLGVRGGRRGGENDGVSFRWGGGWRPQAPPQWGSAAAAARRGTE